MVFRAPASRAGRIPQSVAEQIESRFGFRVPVILRTRAELQRVIERNPFLRSGVDERHLGVGFLEDKPRAAGIASLDPDRSPPDTFAVVGREIYLYCPNGVAHSKLTNQYFDSRLATVSTMRNWKTTRRLLDLTGR